MRVIVEVQSGPATGRRRFLRAGETLEVGRSALMDFAIEEDQQMSGRHFRIVASPGECHIEDLESSNGTEVDGEKITRLPLHDRHTISAGMTRFAVQIEGVTRETVTVQTPDGERKKRSGLETPSETRVTVTGKYIFDPCKSGLQRYRGSTSDFKPSRIMELLSKNFQQTLIVNTPLNEEQSEVFGETEYLLDWLPSETLANGSPWMTSNADAVVKSKIADNAWGQEEMICVYSDPDEELPLAQLRRCAGAFVKPSILRAQLTETVAEVANDLMLEIEAVLVEDEDPASWLILASEDLEPLLASAGLKKTKSTQD